MSERCLIDVESRVFGSICRQISNIRQAVVRNRCSWSIACRLILEIWRYMEIDISDILTSYPSDQCRYEGYVEKMQIIIRFFACHHWDVNYIVQIDGLMEELTHWDRDKMEHRIWTQPFQMHSPVFIYPFRWYLFLIVKLTINQNLCKGLTPKRRKSLTRNKDDLSLLPYVILWVMCLSQGIAR